MRRPSARVSCPMFFVAPIVAALGAGCVGQIGGPGATGSVGSASGSAASSGGAASSGSGAGGAGAAGGALTLADIATRYFPGQAEQNGPARVVRLSRTQLDLTTKTLLPNVALPSAAAMMPSDPLQTNYEYADNLGFNPANFTPYANWVGGIASAVKAAPQTVVDCTPSGNSSACLADRAKSFVRDRLSRHRLPTRS